MASIVKDPSPVRSADYAGKGPDERAELDARFLASWVNSAPSIHHRARRTLAAIRLMNRDDALAFVTAVLMSNATSTPNFPDEE